MTRRAFCRSLKALITAASLAMILPLGQAKQAPQVSPAYRLIILPPPQGYETSTPSSVNNEGVVAGTSFKSDKITAVATLWRQGKPEVFLPERPERGSGAYGISEDGVVLTYYIDPKPTESEATPARQKRTSLLWNPSSRKADYLEEESEDSVSPRGWNGSVVIGYKGQAYKKTIPFMDLSAYAPFAWQAGKMHILPSRQNIGYANAINAHNDIVGQMKLVSRSGKPGTGVDRAALWIYENGNWLPPIELGASGLHSTACGINDKKQIVGYSYLPGGRAFLYENGERNDLPHLENAESSAAFSINNQGEISGHYTITNIKEKSLAERRACLWRDGKMIDLNTTISLQNSVVLNSAVQITDKGIIVGQATQEGRRVGFCLIPNKPLPPSVSKE